VSNTAYAYVRCTEAEAEDSFLGAQAQARAIQAYARFKGLRVEEVFTDEGVAGGVPLEARPAGARLVRLLRDPALRGARLLVYQLERLFSSVGECLALQEEWIARDVDLHVLDMDGQPVASSSPLGRLMFSVLASAQTIEAAAARERTRTSPAKRTRAKGEKPLLGEKVVRGYIVPDPDEMRAVQRIQELAAEGKSLRAIAETLDEEGVPTKRRARAWSKEAIRLILLRIEKDEVRQLRRDAEDVAPASRDDGVDLRKITKRLDPTRVPGQDA